MAIIIPLTENESKLIYNEIPKNLKKPLEQLSYLQKFNNKKSKTIVKRKRICSHVTVNLKRCLHSDSITINR